MGFNSTTQVCDYCGFVVRVFFIGGCLHGGKYHPKKNIAKHDVTKKFKEIAYCVKLHYDHEK